MKIVAGLGRLENAEEYIDAGADELFCGVMPLEWLESRGVVIPLNRREVLLYGTQISSVTDMKILMRLAEKRRIPVAVTLNSTFYPPDVYPEIVRLAQMLEDMGCERLILADMALLMRIRRAGVKVRVHLSGEAGEFSVAALKEWEKWGISRFIFHRKVAFEEMAAVRKAFPKQELEAFILNERCYYTGAMCASLHCDEMPHICKVSGRISGVYEELAVPEPVSREVDLSELGASGCGLCALSALERAGITHLKLVGRGNRPERMVRDIRALKTALACASAVEMKKVLFPNGCSDTCYYREEKVDDMSARV